MLDRVNDTECNATNLDGIECNYRVDSMLLMPALSRAPRKPSAGIMLCIQALLSVTHHLTYSIQYHIHDTTHSAAPLTFLLRREGRYIAIKGVKLVAASVRLTSRAVEVSQKER